MTREWIVFVLREAADKYGGELEPDQRQVICRAAADMLEADAWRPIATAPRDGTKILVFDSRKCMKDDPYATAEWVVDNGFFAERKRRRGRWSDGSVYWGFKPSHWRPIAPPSDAGGAHA